MVKNLVFPVWKRDNGEIISCAEKVKVMRESMDELIQNIQDTYEDALLMDVSSQQFKDFLIQLITKMDSPYN